MWVGLQSGRMSVVLLLFDFCFPKTNNYGFYSSKLFEYYFHTGGLSIQLIATGNNCIQTAHVDLRIISIFPLLEKLRV